MAAIVDLPTALRPTLLEGLLHDLKSEAEANNLPHHKAFSKVALATLGNDDDDFTYSTDGSRDRGIDHYRLSADTAEIFQCKSRDFLDGRPIDTPASEEVLADIPRILTLLKSYKAPATDANRSIKKFLHRFASEIESFKQSLSKVGSKGEAVTRDYTITVKLVALANGLTAPALQTLERYRKQYMVMDIGGLDVLIDIQALFIDDLLRTRWKERNAQWRDIKGKNRDQISVARLGTVIKDKKSWVFYGKAVDLVESFENFGYQLFEPNVRCELKNSRVNAAIKKQVSTKKGIDEFRYLNNGVTIIGDNHSQHGDGSAISITRPGVVNGLQTITTLAECYEHMTDPELKAYFKNECAVLVRLYDKKTIPVTELVKATNNQNPMEPRNLMSNEPEQVVNEQTFAKLGWFYERKQFAWEAFIQDERQWPTLKNLKKQHFQVQKGKAGRPTQRRVDNEDLMQVWLAFVGFLNEAVQKRREFFTNARFYERVFKSRLTKHGFDYDYQWGDDRIDDDALAGGVNATAFLLANSTALIASEFIPSGRQLRDERVAALHLANKSREEQDAKLNEDSQYLAGLVKSAATLLFTELCGFVLLRALGGTLYEKAETILLGTDIRAVFEELDFSALEKQVAGGNPPKEALFSQLWLLFLAVVDDLVDSEVWRNSFFQQSSRPRFMYSAETRKKLLRIVAQWDQTASKRPLNRPWSLHFDKGQGIFRGVGLIVRAL